MIIVIKTKTKGLIIFVFNALFVGLKTGAGVGGTPDAGRFLLFSLILS